MVYDDDTGRRVSFELTEGGRPSEGERGAHALSPKHRSIIIDAGKRLGGVAELVREHLKEHEKLNIPIGVIRAVLAEGSRHRQR